MTAPDPLVLEQLDDATRGLVRDLDQLDDDAWRSPSLLPGWSRAHVAAHLVLNAEGLAGAMEALAVGERRPMYVSPDARDVDIEELSHDEVHPVRDRLLASTTRFADAVRRMDADAWTHEVERVPGGAVFPAAAIPAMRWRELEIHHADLGVGYGPDDWSDELAEHLLEAMTVRARPDRAFRLRATDLNVERDVAEPDTDAPLVMGPGRWLAWWLTGRGSGENLSSSAGELPQIGAW